MQTIRSYSFGADNNENNEYNEYVWRLRVRTRAFLI